MHSSPFTPPMTLSMGDMGNDMQPRTPVMRSAVMVQHDSLYNSLPAYRFPMMPLPQSPMIPSSADFSMSLSHSRGPEYAKPSFVASPVGLNFESPIHHIPQGPMMGSPTKSTYMSSPGMTMSITSPSMSPSISQYPSVDGLAPPLPIITLPEVMSYPTRDYSDYDSSSGLAGQGEKSASRQAQDPYSTPINHNSDVFISSATFPGANGHYQQGYPQSPSQGTYLQYHGSPSTFVPSTSYLPSRPAFTPIMPNMPRSAPSTPLGRQDSRFFSVVRGHTTPQPFHPPSFAPMSSLASNLPLLSPPPYPSGPSYFSDQVSYEQGPSAIIPDPLLMSQTHTPSPAIAGELAAMSASQRVPKLATQKRVSPHSPDIELPPVGKKVKNDKASPVKAKAQAKGNAARHDDNVTRSTSNEVFTSGIAQRATSKDYLSDSKSARSDEAPASISPSELESSPHKSGAGESTDSKSKQPRCRIACNQCRKTRLKCDGLRPCTSCIDKQLKANPAHTEDEARRFIREWDLCQFEDFVRRRGKGKKTIAKEQDDHFTKHMTLATSQNQAPYPYHPSYPPDAAGLYYHVPDGDYEVPPVATYGLGVLAHSRSGSSE